MLDDNKKKVEAAIEKFIKTGKWPKMSPVVGCLVSTRLHWAMGLIDDFNRLNKTLKLNPDRRMTQNTAIKFFLVQRLQSPDPASPTPRTITAIKMRRTKLNI